MKNFKLFTTLKSPHVSEKSNRLGEGYNQYVFKVAKEATKPEVKNAVESLFKVEVSAVNILNQKGKKKNTQKKAGVRKGFKKAYVSLKQGSTLDFDSIE